jgi:GxxExxY protein
MNDILYKQESYKLIGLCMEVHRTLGMGFKEVVYKDALEIEFQNHQISYIREKQFTIEYKGKILPRKYVADFIIYDKIILEAKATSLIVEEFHAQTINYLKASSLKLGIVVNFGERSLKYKRLIL